MPEGASQRNWRKVGVVAGGGDLPVHVAKACAESETPFFVVRLRSLASDELRKYPGVDCNLGEVGKAVKTLRDESCDALTFVGIVRRPNFSSLKPDLMGVSMMPRIIASAMRGDNALLEAIVKIFEEEGFVILGADEIGSNLTAESGVYGVHGPSSQALADMEKAAGVIDALGPFDVGQAAVVCDNLVLAVEAAEGTDEMLKRCADLPETLRGDAQNRRGVLVKLPKPHQERRVDLPVIGVKTIENAAKAGLAGVAVAAGAALVLDRDAVASRANELGLFVYGFDKNEFSDGQQ